MTTPAICLIVTENLYSALGKLLCTTIPVVKGSDNQLGFINTLITFRNPLNTQSAWSSGGPLDTASDLVNWAWANNFAITASDRQYAYQGTFPEGNPLLRNIQSSQPGQVYSIEGETGLANHSTTYTPGYLPAGIDTILPNLFIGSDNSAPLNTQLICSGSEISLGDIGILSHAQISDFKGRLLAKVSGDQNNQSLLSASIYQTGAEFNTDADQPYMNQTQTTLPNYYTLSDTGQLVSTQTNVLGQSIEQNSHDRGTLRNYYDVYGRIRFSQNADQATAGTVIYYLQDALLRPTEIGFLTMAWNVTTFQNLTSGTDATQLPTDFLPTGVTPQPLRQWVYDQAVTASETENVLETIGKITQVSNLNTVINNDNQVIVNTDSQLIEQYGYDYLGRCIVLTQQLNGGSLYTTYYTYESLGRISSITYPQTANSTTNFQVYRTYNIQANIAAVGTADNAYAFASYQYNEFGLVTQENLGSNGQSMNYTYGNASNQLTTYGDAYQLMTANLSYTNSEGNYQDGNIQAVSYSFNSEIIVINNIAVQSYGYNYSYSPFGYLMAATVTSGGNSAWDMTGIVVDGNSNLQSYTLNNTAYTYSYPTGTNQVQNVNGGTNFTYSNGGLTLTTPAGLNLNYDLLLPLPTAITVGDNAYTLIYGSQGERFQKSNGNTTITYLRGLDKTPLAEMIEIDSATTAIIYYIYGSHGLAVINNDTNNYVVIKDHQGSVRLVHQDVTNNDLSSANIACYYNYLPYGATMSDNSQQNSELLLCRYLYTGQEWDSEFSLYNYHARQYDPNLARFYTPDSARQFASPYVYVGNNPINCIDTDGRVTGVIENGSIRLSEVIALFVENHYRTLLIAQLYRTTPGGTIVVGPRYKADSTPGSHAEINLIKEIKTLEIPNNLAFNVDIIINQSPCEDCANYLLKFLNKYPNVTMKIQFAMAARSTGEFKTPTLKALRQLRQTGRVEFTPMDVESELIYYHQMGLEDYAYERVENAILSGRIKGASPNQVENLYNYTYEGANTLSHVSESNFQKATAWCKEINEEIPANPPRYISFGRVAPPSPSTFPTGEL